MSLRVVDSEEVLKALGYDYIKVVDPPLEPKRTNIRFRDIAPELLKLGIELADEYLYEHQLKTLEALRQGHNVILRAGTGSGKTESWYLYFHEKARDGDFRAIAVYPTLALANDQIKRISLYSSAIGVGVEKIDALLRDELVQRLGRTGLRRQLASAKLVITNPAFLFHEIKKLLLTPTACLIDFRRLDMVVLDEFDFYSPRSIALILGMLKIISEYSDTKPQVVVLTATLANPEDMCLFLEDITGRGCTIVGGEPFRVENRLYIVLGKNIDSIWSVVRGYRDKIASMENVDRDIVEALENPEVFKKNLYRVLQYLEALGFNVPSVSIDVKEILARYVNDDGVTLVFTRSIARADEIARSLRELVGDAVASHHHLVSKREREVIEERARRGEVKIVVSPRTLTQGIDIGTVVRIVHIGLTESVREFIQREGRKGRRRSIPFSESIVIPATRWDWELLSKGVEVFERWLSLPIEKTIINPNNKYLFLFTGLAKILSPWYREKPTEKEYEVLREVKVVKKDWSIDLDKARWIWERLNFYEFGPPYGVKRYLEENGRLIPLEPIGHCDLVERFQKGCIDLSQDAIVTRVEAGKSSRIARAVVESRLSRFNLYSDDAIAEAVEEYKYIKMLWREEANILRDITRGKLSSYVLAVVYTPKRGFGEYIKIPNRVIWYLISSRPRIFRVRDRHIVTYDRKTIYIPVETAGMYRDYTYGFYIEADEKDETSLLRIGLAYLMVFLRKVYAIPFETIMYSVGKIGEKKFFEIHEPESAGLIETLDWARVRRDLEVYTPEDLDLVLLLQLDDIAYTDLVSMGLDLDVAKEMGLRVLDYILLRERIRATLKGVKVSIPKPSRALKIITLEALSHIIDEDEVVKRAIAGLGVFDGEEVRSVVEFFTLFPFVPPPKSLRDFEVAVEDESMYSGMRIVVYDRDTIARELDRVGLKRLSRAVREYGYSLRDNLVKLGLEPVSINTLVQELSVEGIDIDLGYSDIVDLHKSHLNYIEMKRDLKELGDEFRRALEKYLESRAKILYLLYLVSDALLKERGAQ